MPKIKTQFFGNGIQVYPNLIKYKQPNDSIINIYLKGDAAISWATTIDGYTILPNNKGFYEYAIKNENEDLILSGVIVNNINSRTKEEKELIKKINKNIFYSKNQIELKKDNYYKSKCLNKTNNLKSFPSSGEKKFLVLMVGFSDLTFQNGVERFDSLMNYADFTAVGSFKDYHFQNSNMKLIVNTTVDGIYTAPKSHDYYGQDNNDDKDINIKELVTSLIMGADNYIDFSEYDNDNDGTIDALYIIYAGTGQAESGNTNDIWPHQGFLQTPLICDGVSINSYACSNEINSLNIMSGIGTICHEFGHALGLPDFYDTDYGQNGQAEGTGKWDLMAGGNYNGDGYIPANHNPISKELLEWQSPTKIENNGHYILPSATSDSIVYLIESSSSNEAFYLEHRWAENFDIELPNFGMLIYHCDYDYFMNHFNDNNINADPSHQGVDIEEADFEILDPFGDPFPGSTYTTIFSDITFPNSILWNGQGLGKTINNIEINPYSYKMEFDISGFTGIKDVEIENDLQVYPTIVSDFINISSKNNIKEIIIYNSFGEKILCQNINAQNCKISTSDLKEGFYMIKINITGLYESRNFLKIY